MYEPVERTAVRVLGCEAGRAVTLSRLHGALVAEAGPAAGTYGQLYDRLRRAPDRFELVEPPDLPWGTEDWPDDLRREYGAVLRHVGVVAEPRVRLKAQLPAGAPRFPWSPGTPAVSIPPGPSGTPGVPRTSGTSDTPDIPGAAGGPGAPGISAVLAVLEAALHDLWPTVSGDPADRGRFAEALARADELRRASAGLRPVGPAAGPAAGGCPGPASRHGPNELSVQARLGLG